jgi:hypothetical protein
MLSQYLIHEILFLNFSLEETHKKRTFFFLPIIQYIDDDLNISSPHVNN